MYFEACLGVSRVVVLVSKSLCLQTEKSDEVLHLFLADFTRLYGSAVQWELTTSPE